MSSAHLMINKATSFSKDLILRGMAGVSYSDAIKYVDIPLKIVVCGDETLTLKD